MRSSSFCGQKMLEELSRINITGEMFRYSFLPAFRQAEAHAERVRSQRDKKKVEVREEPNSQVPAGQERVTRVQVGCLSTGSLTHLQAIFLVLGFIFDPKHSHADDYQLVLLKTKKFQPRGRKRQRTLNQTNNAGGSDWTQKLAFWCLDPSIIFKNMCDSAHSVILTSGTLSPVSFTLNYAKY
jgi:hypothetical protein